MTGINLVTLILELEHEYKQGIITLEEKLEYQAYDFATWKFGR